MVINKPSSDNARKDDVKKRSQTLNSRTNKYVKRDADTGKFMDVKKCAALFKGVIREKVKLLLIK